MPMNEWLASVYDTNGAAEESQETQKLAHAELFAKLAAQQGIDLQQLDADTIGELYNEVFHKEASSQEEDQYDASGELLEAAQEHWQEKRAFQEKLAETDFMGRVMAHSYVDELRKIKLASEHSEDEDEDEDEKKEKKLPPFLKKKEEGEKEASAQAFEQLAVDHAVKVASVHNYDPEEAAARINSVITLGLIGETEKTAHAQNVEQAVHVRGLEYLESAGYPVNWEEVFGS